jgi:hypothetical protein
MLIKIVLFCFLITVECISLEPQSHGNYVIKISQAVWIKRVTALFGLFDWLDFKIICIKLS